MGVSQRANRELRIRQTAHWTCRAAVVDRLDRAWDVAALLVVATRGLTRWHLTVSVEAHRLRAHSVPHPRRHRQHVLPLRAVTPRPSGLAVPGIGPLPSAHAIGMRHAQRRRRLGSSRRRSPPSPGMAAYTSQPARDVRSRASRRLASLADGLRIPGVAKLVPRLAGALDHA